MKSKAIILVCLYSLLGLGLTNLFAPTEAKAYPDREDPGKQGDGDYQIGPEYTVDPDLKDRGNPKGKSFEFSMALADSKIFRGDDPTLQPQKKPVRQVRKVFVYVPAAYKDRQPITTGYSPASALRQHLRPKAITTDSSSA
jgi:iron(III)-enterobactin esterase